MTKAQLLIQLVAEKGLIRARDLANHNISRVFLERLCKQGILERIDRGVYGLVDRDVTQQHALALAVRRVPHGLIVLLSALQLHGLTTQLPSEVWLAIDRTARKPRVTYPPLRIVRFSGPNLVYGVEEQVIEGQRLRVTSKAKTVADCFKYRNKLGVDVAIEALRDFVRGGGSIDELAQAAGVCRVSRIMRPYMESVT